MIPIYTVAAISDNHQDGIDDPKFYKAATESALADRWEMLMNAELDAIGQQHVLADFVQLSEGRKDLPSHWSYTIMRDGAGNVQRFKARQVCGGNHQIEGIDNQAMYMQTARLGHVGLAPAIAAKYDLEIHQMDVCLAFLGVGLEEEIYMHPPQGCFCLLQNGTRFKDPTLTKTLWKIVLHLRKSLYGLKQSSQVGYSTCKDFVIWIRFVVSLVDGGRFVLEDQRKLIAAVVLSVDDLLIIANAGLIGQSKDQIKKKFRMHDLSSLSFDLGMNIEHNREHHTINIHQHSCIRTILAKFRKDMPRPVAMPMPMKLHKRMPDEEACHPTIYQSMIGSLMYAMTATRPNITYAIGVLSLYNHYLSYQHMVALKHVFRYLNGTKDWRLHLGAALRASLGAALGASLGAALAASLGAALGEITLRGEGEGTGTLRCFVDSDYAGCSDDYKSTSGLVITFGAVVTWRLRKQMSTAQSTTDAEYHTFGVGCMRLTVISHLFSELGIPTIPHVFSHSQSLIASIMNRIYRGTAVAHIATKYYLAAGMASDGEIDLSYKPTAEMLADCFTKPLPKPDFLKQCAAIGTIGIGHRNGLRNVLRDGLGNALGTLRNGRGNDIGTGHGIWNAIGM